MTKSLEPLNQAKGRVTLSASRKARLKTNLISYMGLNPVRGAGIIRHSKQRSFGIFISNLFIKPMPLVSVVVAIAVLLGGGTAVAANNALPNSALHEVKTNINEQVQLALTMDADAKAELEAELAARRLEEAVKLSERNELNAEAQARIQENFERFEDRVEARIARLEAEGKTELAAQLRANFLKAVEAHQEVLARLAARAENNSAENKLNTAANVVLATATITKYEVKNNGDVKIEATLNEAQNALTQGQIKLKSGDTETAIKIGNQVIQLSEDARVQIKIKSEARGSGNSGRTEVRNDVRVESKSNSNRGSGNSENRTEVKIEGNGEVEVKLENR
jgi:tetratricopeptide (TPR) repeat protein